MKRTQSSFVACLFWLLVISRPAIAQPDLWSVEIGVPSIFVHDIATGAVRLEMRAPAGICLSEGAMSGDGRWYFLPTSVGIARIDVATRRLLDLTPRPVACNSTMLVSPSGRWWHIFEAVPSRRATTIDAITKQVVHDEALGHLSVRARFDALGTRRYELRRSSTDSAAFVQAWPDGPSNAPVWSLQFGEGGVGSVPADIAVGPEGLYVAIRLTGGTVEIRRLDLLTGAELARVQVTLHSANAAIHEIAVFDGRVYLSTGVLSPLQSDRQTLVSFNALTLAIDTTLDVQGGGFFSQLFFDTAAHVGYVERGTCQGRFCSVALQSFDLATLSLNTAVPLNVGRLGGASFGPTSRPGGVRLDAVNSGGRIVFNWQPDASGAVASEFEVRGAVRGQPLQRLALVDGNARSYTSEPVPSGSYTVEVIARNVVGASAATRVDVGVGDPAVPGLPLNLTAETTDSVTRLRWQAPASGALPSVYYILAKPTGSSFFFASVFTSLTEFFAAVPFGNWDVRVQGFNEAGFGPPSNIVSFTSRACTTAPSAPTALATMTGGTFVTLQWAQPSSGLPSEYVLDVGFYPGRFELGQVPIPGGRPSLQVEAPSGYFSVRVRARNACGQSAPSNEVVVFVP